MKALDLPRREEVAVEIAAEALLDTGTQHLDGHGTRHAIVDRDRLVHLGDGSSRYRRAELGEVILHPAAERRLHRAARLLHGKRRQLVLQMAQVLGEVRADQVGARGQELAELDVAGPEAGQGIGDAGILRAADAQRPGESADGQRRGARQMQRPGDLHPGRHEAHAVLGQHDAGAAKAQDAGETGCHGRSVDARPSHRARLRDRTLPERGLRSSGTGTYPLREIG